MSYNIGESAFSLEMPDRVPRTEYSAHTHWDLVNAVCNLNVSPNSTEEEKQSATSAFVKAWDYDFMYNTPLDHWVLGDNRTKMGHAEYSTAGSDFDSERFELFEDFEDIYTFDFMEAYGPVDQKRFCNYFNENYAQRKKFYPDALNTSGMYISLMSGMIEICGWDSLLMAAGADYKSFGEFANEYAKWVIGYFEALAQSDIPVVSVHDDIVWASGPFLPHEWYRKYIFPNYKKLFEPLHDAKKRILYICDGNFTPFIDDIASCGVHGFVMEPTTDMAYIAERYGKTHVFIGNADTRILLRGSDEDIVAEVKRCMDIGKSCPGFIMAVGNHIPSNTPIEKALVYNDAYKKFSRR